MNPRIDMSLPTAASLRRQGEAPRIAFARDMTPEAVGPLVVSLLNGAGGTVVAGILASGPIRVAEPPNGLEAEQARGQLHRALTHNISPAAPISLTVDDSLGKPCLLIEVPAGVDRPYVYNGTIYLRPETNLRRATASDITALLARPQDQPTRWERQMALGVETTDLDAYDISEVLLNAERRDITVPMHLFGGVIDDPNLVMEKLDYLNVASAGVLHNAALVLFGRNVSSLLPQTQVRAVARYGDDPGDFSDSRVFPGNAFQLFDQALEFVRRHVPITSTLSPGEVVREDTPAFPLFALREALLNALVHRDYNAPDGGVSLLIFPDRIEIWNAGELPSGLTTADLQAGIGVSRPRNPDIANVFLMRGLIERMGLGTQRIAYACREAGLPEPEWSEQGGGVRLVLRRVTPFRRGVELPRRIVQFLEKLPDGIEFDASDYTDFLDQQKIALSSRAARLDLQRLVDSGHVMRIGSTSATRYQKR